MHKIDQQLFNPAGVGLDCWKACIASLLDLEYSEVPELIATSRVDQMADTQAFLSTLGMQMKTGWVSHLPKIDTPYFIGSGKSPRSTPEKTYHHAVVVELDEEGLVHIVHDPHPSRSGIQGDFTYFYWIEEVSD